MKQTLLKFENGYRSKLVIAARLLIAFLFIFSALAKLFPIVVFEKQLIDISNQEGIFNGFTNWCNVRWWSRSIIISELFIGIMLIFPYYLKRVFLPISAILLLVFIGYLSIQISNIGNIGNCGCMGGWLPMSPIEAIIKNFITLGLILYVYKNVLEKNIVALFIPIGILTTVMLVVIFNSKAKEECCCHDQIRTIIQLEKTSLQTQIDSLEYLIVQSKFTGDLKSEKNDTTEVPKVVYAQSEFHFFNEFERNGKLVNKSIDKGNSIVIIANPDCEHCKDLTTKIAKLNLTQNTSIYILFHNPDETEIEVMKTQAKQFIKNCGIHPLYKILQINDYMKLLGSAPSPPRLVLLVNGLVKYEYIGDGLLNMKKIKDFTN